ncbi:MAG: SGNH/GDSL hydrolase family protein [Bacteroidia bacterium]
MKNSLLRFFSFIYPTLIVLAVVEIVFRLMGFPNEKFNFLRMTDTGIYPPNEDMELTWGTFPYRVKTNSLGLRGNEPGKDTSALRIAAIGDSVTDGFFLDNEEIWTHKLNELFKSQGAPAEVLNVARGRASIDKELALLREVALPLNPDIVLLTFTSNDIPELLDKDLDEILRLKAPFQPRNMKLTDQVFIWLINYSAACNAIYSYIWEQKTSNFSDYFNRGIDWEPDEHEKNIALFRKHFGGDQWILEEPFSARTNELVANYLTALHLFFTTCREQNAQPVFIYNPSIVVVYEPESSTRMPELIEAMCKQHNVPFLDLTPDMRNAGRDTIIFLAPYDFHNNAAGNTVIANSIYEFLQDEFPEELNPEL